MKASAGVHALACLPAWFRWTGPLVLLLTVGCQSPYYADQGALFGGVTGAGVGAIVGNAVGDPLAGAAIGGGVGALTGAAVGGSLDEIEAKNRAQIAAQMRSQVRTGAVTIEDVVAMTRSGVGDRLIANHVQYNGMARPLSSGDLIFLKEQGVSDTVIQAMQAPPARPVAVASSGPPVIVEEHYYGPPAYYLAPAPGYYYHRHYPRRPRTSVGVAISN